MGLRLDTSKLYRNETEEATVEKEKKVFSQTSQRHRRFGVTLHQAMKFYAGGPPTREDLQAKLMSLKLNLYTVYTIFAACGNIY